jgi:hypothetical protein
MLTAIDFDYKARIETKKVNDVTTSRHLSLEFKSHQATIA